VAKKKSKQEERPVTDLDMTVDPDNERSAGYTSAIKHEFERDTALRKGKDDPEVTHERVNEKHEDSKIEEYDEPEATPAKESLPAIFRSGKKMDKDKSFKVLEIIDSEDEKQK